MMAVDGSILTTMSGAMEALSGYLLLTLLTSTLPLISHHFADFAATGTHQNMTPKLLTAGRYDIYQPVECLMLYLAAYPLLSAYRSTEGWSAAILCILLCALLHWLQPKISSLRTSSAPKSNMEVSHGGSVGEDAPHSITTQGSRVVETTLGSKHEIHIVPLKDKAEQAEPSPGKSVVAPLPRDEESSFARSRKRTSKPNFTSRSNTEDEDALSVVTWDPSFKELSESSRQTLQPSSTNKRKDYTRTQSCHDTSLLKEMDGELIDSNLEPHYSNLIDSANAPIFGVDCEGRVNVWNRCAMRIVGYTPDEVMGKNLVREFITKDYQASVGMVIDQALHGDETANL